jgi:hypothetical protein
MNITLYTEFCIIHCFINCGRSWNILPVDTRAHLYKYLLILNKVVVKEVTFCGMMQVWRGVSWRRRGEYVCNGEG